MDRLPTVLHNEVFAYMRGDRNHWKAQYRSVPDDFDSQMDRLVADLEDYSTDLRFDDVNARAVRDRRINVRHKFNQRHVRYDQ